MREFAWHLDISSDPWNQAYNKSIPEAEWGDMHAAQKHLDTYWLSLSEYKEVWQPIQQSLFTNADTLPDLIFKPSYELLILEGGNLFMKEDFEVFQHCMIALGESHFVIIQNDFNGKLKEPSFRMKYPVTITWDELISGNFIFTVLFEKFHNEYYLFGSSDRWGRYTASDAIYPIHIVGFKPEYSSFFHRFLTESTEEQKRAQTWLLSNK